MCTWAYLSYWGVTKLKFVTGTHKQASKFVNPRTKRLHTGVGSQEYTEVLSQLFVPEGNRLFQGAGKWADKWQLQQDNARPHTTAANKAYTEANVPGRKFPAWPANFKLQQRQWHLQCHHQCYYHQCYYQSQPQYSSHTTLCWQE